MATVGNDSKIDKEFLSVLSPCITSLIFFVSYSILILSFQIYFCFIFMYLFHLNLIVEASFKLDLTLCTQLIERQNFRTHNDPESICTHERTNDKYISRVFFPA